jgi:hypothetical protein
LTPTPTPTPSPGIARATPPSLPGPTRRGVGLQRRPLAVVLFSVIACGLLVAAASVVPLGGKAHHANGTGTETMEPSAYAMKATADVARLAELPALPDVGVGGLAGADAASAALQQQLEAALADLEAKLAEASAGLPEVPAGYLPGSDVEVDLPVAQGYPLPSLPVPDLGLGALQLQAPSLSDSPVGTGSASPLDSLVGQLEGLNDQLAELTGGDSPLSNLPVEDLPVIGGPSQVQQADDTVQPDEAGALAASLHAQSALDLTESSYTSAVSDLQSRLDLYNKLADQVEEAIARIHELQGEAKGEIDSTLDGRLKEIRHDASALEAQANGLVSLHGKAVADAQRTAAGAIAAATSAQSAAVAQAGQATVGDLKRQVLAVQADAQERKDAIAALVQTAGTDLGTSDDALQALQAVQAAAAAATVKVDRDAKAQVADLEAQMDGVQDLVAHSQSELQAAADGALEQVNASTEEAVAGDADVLEFLEAQAHSYGSLMEARETRMALEAAAELQDLADGRSQAVVDEALTGTRGVAESLTQAGAQVGQVQKTLLGQVGKDLDYVAKVGDDYGRVPTEERKARAEHWSTVALGLDGALDQAIGQGHTLETLARQVIAAAHQAETQVSAMA